MDPLVPNADEPESSDITLNLSTLLTLLVTHPLRHPTTPPTNSLLTQLPYLNTPNTTQPLTQPPKLHQDGQGSNGGISGVVIPDTVCVMLRRGVRLCMCLVPGRVVRRVEGEAPERSVMAIFPEPTSGCDRPKFPTHDLNIVAPNRTFIEEGLKVKKGWYDTSLVEDAEERVRRSLDMIHVVQNIFTGLPTNALFPTNAMKGTGTGTTNLVS